MKRILITGGTVFVSRYIAEYYTKFIPEYQSEDKYEVYVMNRGTHNQIDGVNLLCCDKNNIGDHLVNYDFDVVIAVNIYTKDEMKNLVDGLHRIKDFIFISSSAVYPETLLQPFTEEQPVGYNSIWGDYGKNKYEAEQYLLQCVPQAYILRPPYLYGRMQNLYREGFVFECAMSERPFYIPKDGSMKLHFFHVNDLCRFIDILLRQKPAQHIFNVGNSKVDDINSFVEVCYKVVGANLKKVYINDEHPQRSYFPFHDYSYSLDVSRMLELMPETMPLLDGLKDSYRWFKCNDSIMNRKPYFEYIEKNFC